MSSVTFTHLYVIFDCSTTHTIWVRDAVTDKKTLLIDDRSAMAFDMSRCGDLLSRLVHTGCDRAGQVEGGQACVYDFYDVTKLGQAYHRLETSPLRDFFQTYL